MTGVNKVDRLRRAQKRVRIAAGVRMFFMILTLLLILIVFFCNKFAAKTDWYPGMRPVIYDLLVLSAVIMLAAIAVKVFLAARYQKMMGE